MRSHGAAFAPLPTWQEEEEPPTPKPPLRQQYGQSDHVINTYDPYDPVHKSAYAASRQPPASSASTHPASVVSGSVDGTPIADAHMRNHSNELDDFSHSYTAAVGQIPHDEDRQPLTTSSSEYHNSGSEFGSPFRQGDGPLWQQNRRSQNVMWM
jgi:hypothetical protein